MTASTPHSTPPGWYRIRKRWSFAAAHHLPLGEHKCARHHGHTYTVEVIVDADALNGPGWVDDFGALAPVKHHLDAYFDHRDLSTVLDVPPTAEHLAEHLASWFRSEVEPGIAGRLAGVCVSESPETVAEFWIQP